MQMYDPGRSGRSFGAGSIFLAVFLGLIIGWKLTSAGILGELDFVDVEDEQIGEVSEDLDLSLLWVVKDILEEKYYSTEKLDNQEMVYGAIEGLVRSLEDPYTVFMTPVESDSFSDGLEGKLEGIGAEMTIENERVTVVSPLRESPAEKAGLLPGDVVIGIDGESALELSLLEAVMRIRGERGTKVVLTVYREGVDEPFDLSIVRDKIELESVTVEKMDEGIVYLGVNQFNDKTLDEFGGAVSEMLLDKPEGLIVDLRFNGGGYLDIAVDLLSFLLPNDEVGVILKQNGVEDDVRRTSEKPKILDVPLVVLINEGSASASEIVAGAIQDLERGVIMGTQSFGKGTVQEIEMFKDGSSMRLTIAKWFTSKERDIDGIGIEPDIVLEPSEEDAENDIDSQKEAAAEYLRNL